MLDDLDAMGESGGIGLAVKGKDRREREREFRIASVGFADTLGMTRFHSFLTGHAETKKMKLTLCSIS